MERDTKIGIAIGVILACVMSLKSNGDILSGFATHPVGSIVYIIEGYLFYLIFLVIKDSFVKKDEKEKCQK